MIYAKVNLWDEDTKTLTEIDERIFSDCVTFQLQIIREKAKELILQVAPDYKQRNASLGLLTQQETEQIKTDIQNIRNISNQKETQILSIVWDGTEQNRPSACDAVQSIKWD
jgi:hypothetical protein